MRRNQLIVVAFLLTLYIAPMIFISSYGHTATPAQPNMVKEFQVADSWYSGSWQYRRNISITGSTGAGTFYQVRIVVSYDSDMQTDFDDILFTDYDGSTLLDHWREVYVASGYAIFWVEVADNLDTNQFIYMYYGNGVATSASNGTETFLFFDDFENDNLNRWDYAGAYWSTTTSRVHSGTYAAFADAGADFGSRKLQEDISAYNDIDIMIHFWLNQEVQTSKEFWFRSNDTSADNSYPLVGDTINWKYDNGPYLDWESSTYLDDTWFEIDLAFDYTNSLFRLWLDNVSKGSQDLEDIEGAALTSINNWEIIVDSGAGEDIWFDDVYIRNWVLVEPVVGAFGSEEDYDDFPKWHIVGTAILNFSVLFDMWGMDMALIILGLVMIPTSTIYLAYGAKHDRSSDRLFYGLIIFFLGCGLLIGGVMP